MIRNLIIIMMSSLILFSSCTSTRITSSWVDPDLSNANYQKLLVLGMFQPKDQSLRTRIENQFVKQLGDGGITVKSGFEQYGPKAFQSNSEDEVIKKLKATGYDAILTTTLLDKSKDQYYNQGTSRLEPVGYARVGRYITTIYDRVYQPGYYTTSTEYFLESNLYDLKTGDLVYSVQSKTADPSSAYNLGNNYSKRITDLQAKGLLKK